MATDTRRPYMVHEDLYSMVHNLGADAKLVYWLLFAEAVEPFTDQIRGVKRPPGFDTLLDAGVIRRAAQCNTYEFDPAWMQRSGPNTVAQAAELVVAVYDDPHASAEALRRSMDTLRTLLADQGS